MSTSPLIYILGVLATVLLGSGGFLGWLAQRNQFSAARLRDLEASFAAKEKEADRARANQRTLEDYANDLRTQISAAGLTPKEWPHYE